MSSWGQYWAIAHRRWMLIVAVLVLDVLASGYLYKRDRGTVGFQACLTLYIADVSSPSMITAPPTTLETAGQLLAGETAANFFADDILDVAESSSVATYVASHLRGRGFFGASVTNINGSVTGSRKDRTDNICVASPYPGTALAAAKVLGVAMTRDRGVFVGAQMAKRTFVDVVSPPGVAPASSSHLKLDFALRLVLGLFVALGLALLWDALDPSVRDRYDAERALGVPVVAVFP